MGSARQTLKYKMGAVTVLRQQHNCTKSTLVQDSTKSTLAQDFSDPNPITQQADGVGILAVDISGNCPPVLEMSGDHACSGNQ